MLISEHVVDSALAADGYIVEAGAAGLAVPAGLLFDLHPLLHVSSNLNYGWVYKVNQLGRNNVNGITGDRWWVVVSEWEDDSLKYRAL